MKIIGICVYVRNFRNINGVRGFSRETLIAIAANIESREWRREFNVKHNIPAAG